VILAWSYVAAWAQNSWVLWVLSVALWLQTIRRLHDVGRTGWWVAAVMVGEIALLALPGSYPDAAWAYWLTALFPAVCFLLISVLPGEPGDNRFGSPGARRARTNAAA
jgi:uncharacterized membrane protein YhaH (DUF805 family)